jgi:hypothetical protein
MPHAAIQNVVQPFINVFVLKAEYMPAARFQIRLAFSVVPPLGIASMRLPIDLDHEAREDADEIGDIGANRMLPAEAMAEHDIPSEPRP